MTQDLSQLTQRLEKLERQNRVFKFAGLGLAGVMAFGSLGLTLAARGPSTMICDTVSAERFVLHDGRGNKRMVMDAYNTEPSLQLRNRSGKTVASFGVNDKKGEPFLTFFDASGKAKTNSKSESCAPTDCSSKKDDGSIAMR